MLSNDLRQVELLWSVGCYF